jgi:hypothetical protein
MTIDTTKFDPEIERGRKHPDASDETKMSAQSAKNRDRAEHSQDRALIRIRGRSSLRFRRSGLEEGADACNRVDQC